MPYIDRDERLQLNSRIQKLALRISELPEPHKGQLNYVYCELACALLPEQAGYQERSEALAALRDAADEFYRRVVLPYEKTKQIQNGDLHGFEEVTSGVFFT